MSEASRLNDVSLILKCTRRCNFACSYCTDRRKSTRPLNFENLVHIIASTLERESAGNTTFIFHGGEPLTLGREYFQKLLDVETLCVPNPETIRNIIQTNASLIDDQWAAFFRRNHIQVGVSQDGPADVQDLQRRYANNRTTSSDVRRGVECLLRNEVGFGVLCVVTPAIMKKGAHELFDFFLRSGVTRVGFLPLRPSSAEFASPEERRAFYKQSARYAKFMGEMYKIWVDSGDTSIVIRELSNIMSTLLGGSSTTCVGSGPCVGRHFGVEPSGEVNHCDKFLTDERFSFGHIAEQPFSAILRSEALKRAQELEMGLRENCARCDWFTQCKGGCLYHAALFAGAGLQDRSEVCHLRPIYDLIDSDIRRRIGESVKLPNSSTVADHPMGSG